jgi:hypothetical protein
VDDIRLVGIADLATTWRTLTDVADNYSMTSPGWASLIEARRLIEVEIRAQHGDAVWTDLVAD